MSLFRRVSSVSAYPSIGFMSEPTGDYGDKLAQFLCFVEETLVAQCRADAGDTVCDEAIRGSAVSWKRLQGLLFPLLIEQLVVEDGGEPFAKVRPGVWRLRADALDPVSDNYFEKEKGEWVARLQGLADDPRNSGGICINVLEVPKAELGSGAIDVRPLVLHALDKEGRAVDRGNLKAQAAISNAFWQTFWATGAHRAERGRVFPVAFLPVDRTCKYEFAAPFKERYVSLRRRLFGRTSIVAYVLEHLTQQKALVYDLLANHFAVAAEYQSSAECKAADVLLAVRELNRTGFVDAYTGDNKETFSVWRDLEEGVKAEPWPFGDESRSPRVKTQVTPGGDVLATVRSSTGAGLVVIPRVVPFAGCAFLNEVVNDTASLIESGKIQDFEGELLGATNSTFFLNFPEEYANIHSAMNDAVSLLVEAGRTVQMRTLRRATFMISEDGKPAISTRVGNKLESEVLVFEGESSSASSFEKSEKSHRENKFGPLFFGAVVVGNSIVETFEEEAASLPMNGWGIGDSEAFGGALEPENAVSAQYRRMGELQEVALRHAFSVGPMLLEGGQVVPLGESKEDFRSMQASQQPGFEESSVLPRTELPAAFSGCEARGVPPTRFPYDWNKTRAPRTAIGIKDDGSVVLAVVDGRADMRHSAGATLAELAAVMQSLGCVDAMNMDGGGSSVMFVNSEEARAARLRDNLSEGIVNLPSDLGGTERMLPVPLVVYRRKRLLPGIS